MAAVASRRWPDRCEADLRAHVASCDVCRDVAEVAVAFGADQDAAWQRVHVPSAAHVWWRLQMRARQDAERAALRPIAVVQGVAAMGAAGLAIAAIVFGWAARSWSLPTLSALSDLAADVPPLASTALNAVLAVAVSTPQTTVLVGVIAAGLVLMPVAVYLALSE